MACFPRAVTTRALLISPPEAESAFKISGPYGIILQSD